MILDCSGCSMKELVIPDCDPWLFRMFNEGVSHTWLWSFLFFFGIVYVHMYSFISLNTLSVTQLWFSAYRVILAFPYIRYIHWTVTWTIGSLTGVYGLFACMVYTQGTSVYVMPYLNRLKDFCGVCIEFGPREISGRAQSLAHNAHPSV